MFIGVKMLGSSYFEIPTVYALVTIVVVLAISVALSLVIRSPETASAAE